VNQLFAGAPTCAPPARLILCPMEPCWPPLGLCGALPRAVSRQDAAIGEDRIPVKLGLTAIALAALLSAGITLSQVALAQQQQSPVPDAPTPQPHPPLSGAEGTITPGLGAGDEATSPASPSTSSSTSSTEGAPQNPAARRLLPRGRTISRPPPRRCPWPEREWRLSLVLWSM
jgi:hypothetical protein